MRAYNKKIEIIRVFKHFILEWEDQDAAEKESASSALQWSPRSKHYGTEVYDSKKTLLERIGQLL